MEILEKYENPRTHARYREQCQLVLSFWLGYGGLLDIDQA